MAKFDLSKYATVAERLELFAADWPDGRIVTHNLTTPQDRAVSTWVVKTEIFLTAGDQAAAIPKATGHAFEIDGGSGPQGQAALEVCETSSVGRALMLAGYAASKTGSLASREEIEKVSKPRNVRDLLGEAANLKDVETLRMLYAQAKAADYPKAVLEGIKLRAESLSSMGKGGGN